jgi:predicted MFS family arabinose efflux permease
MWIMVSDDFGLSSKSLLSLLTQFIQAKVIFVLSFVCAAPSPRVALLMVARIFNAIAIGLASFIAPMYIAELVQARGVVLWSR